MSGTLTPPKPRTESVSTQRSPLSVLRTEFDDLWNRVWNVKEDGWFTGVFSPNADLAETDNAFQLKMDIPGMQAKDIDIQVRGNQVTVSGQREEEKEEKGKSFHRIERRSGNFSRSLTLPCGINESEVAAEYNQGVLTVVLPKSNEAKAKRINVKS